MKIRVQKASQRKQERTGCKRPGSGQYGSQDEAEQEEQVEEGPHPPHLTRPTQTTIISMTITAAIEAPIAGD